jgi:GNAT superfamily N-acetyltransferase
MKNLNIRFAEPADTPLILRFIKELAAYEKLAHEVVATKEILDETLFGEKSYAEVIIAEYHGQPVGYTLFFHNFSTFLGRPGIYIEDIYVTPEYRGKGIGKALLNYCAMLARKRKCGRMEWWVLKWNPARDFYEKIGAEAMDEWVVYRLTGESMEKMAEGSEDSGER